MKKEDVLKVHIKDLEDLYNFAKEFSKCLKGNELILLYGDLSAGKTTFTKALVSSIYKSLENEVNSPTFTVMNVYETPKFPIYHIDLYRVKEFDISDIVGNGLIIVEWANFQDFSGYDTPKIEIKIELKNDRRIFYINGNNIEKCLKS
ncbi:MAG: tRNA (adenosine(37)-N6)-threonylcarbamoyltransferase complex ATPase subunit type 1 TsaE [Hydrogenothermus sp.]|nr:MAG: tRNA (adenosine(37)-N6)-threonylcarbamoyltransferase complex ATPase subunit type 1 TsaE [Hydrogenothermus sp.]